MIKTLSQIYSHIKARYGAEQPNVLSRYFGSISYGIGQLLTGLLFISFCLDTSNVRWYTTVSIRPFSTPQVHFNFWQRIRICKIQKMKKTITYTMLKTVWLSEYKFIKFKVLVCSFSLSSSIRLYRLVRLSVRFTLSFQFLEPKVWILKTQILEIISYRFILIFNLKNNQHN